MVKVGESYGFCVDNSPDEGIHRVVENLYVASQDGARNYRELTDQRITHILNVATGVANPFPKARGIGAWGELTLSHPERGSPLTSKIIWR